MSESMVSRGKKSTIVRTYSTAGHRLVRAAFRTVDPVLPGLTARWAMRIWCTPPAPRRRAVASSAGPAAPGAPALGPGTRFTVPLPGTTVVADAWGDDGPVTYLLHGWGGWRGQLGGLVAPLVGAGHRVVALDAPGHGESGPGRLGGRRTTLVDIADALAAVVGVTGPAHSVIAHSGGASATALAVQDGLAAARLVFVAPMADPMTYLEPFTHLLGLGDRSRARFTRMTEQVIGRSMTDFDVPGWAAAAAPDQLPPLLVVHDRGDRRVHYADGHAIAAAWPGATLRTTEGLGHQRILADPEVIDAAVSFVTRAPVGSGEPTAELANELTTELTTGLTAAGTAAGSTGRS